VSRRYEVIVFGESAQFEAVSRSQAIYLAYKAFREAGYCASTYSLPHFTKVALQSCRVRL
jgi:hypothetical protein